MPYNPPSINEMQHFMQQVRTIAVVGLSPKPDRPSYRVATALQGWGYRIVPVHPALDTLLGERAYPNLASIPFPIDLTDFFVNPTRLPALVTDSITLKIPGLWLQEGVIHPEAAAQAQAAGLFVVMDRCLYRDLQQGLLPLRNR